MYTYIYQDIKYIDIIADHVGSITQSMCLNYSAFSLTAFVPKRSARDENTTASYYKAIREFDLHVHDDISFISFFVCFFKRLL